VDARVVGRLTTAPKRSERPHDGVTSSVVPSATARTTA
jgi:hypothetical protein